MPPALLLCQLQSVWPPAALSTDEAVNIWEGLIKASPHGCRIHLTGGEPFGDFELLLEICRSARQKGLGPLESIETNGFWADDDERITQKLEALDEAGMGSLAISADPYHQQFVPIERRRRLAALARKLLGEDRVRVRWEDWLSNGRDTSDMSEDQRPACFKNTPLPGASG